MKMHDSIEDFRLDCSDARRSANGWHVKRSRIYGDRYRSTSDGGMSLPSHSSSSVGILSAGGESVAEDLGNIKCRSHGSVSLCGWRREMEDAVTVAPGFYRSAAGESGFRYDFFAVYDGHGGAAVAQLCSDRLHLVLAEEMEGRGGGGEEEEWKEVMEECFGKMDEEVREEAEAAGDEVAVSTAKTVGSTAVVAVVGIENVVVANCGDSRAVLSRGGVAVPLSYDHKPDRPDEMERVEAAGGNVINWDGCRVLGVLATSRSIGDHYLKPYVISKPEVVVMERTDLDEFLILASDGLWDVVSNEMACNVVRRCLAGRSLKRLSKGSAAEAAAMLAELAMGRGSKDNISVVVIDLSGHNGGLSR
ncbi:hypothetical protein MRB53_035682 [Persea americana]|uniref:Uncharacterized protein n=1 Tax=Persea americana TaxID=3435 RepID=A0ACC2K5B8_PERAE|nr:hypothetical protein MRB53_035682 [Persea americana]